MTTDEFFEKLEKIEIGTIIPKPKTKSQFKIKGWGNRRGERALVYYIPNNNMSNKPYQKGISVSEWRKAYNHLAYSGEFNLDWFKKNLPACYKEGSCNYSTMGGIFELLGVAKYYEKGSYLKTDKNNNKRK